MADSDTVTYRTSRHHWTEDEARSLELSETGKIYGYGKARAARRARGYVLDDDLQRTLCVYAEDASKQLVCMDGTQELGLAAAAAAAAAAALQRLRNQRKESIFAPPSSLPSTQTAAQPAAATTLKSTPPPQPRHSFADARWRGAGSSNSTSNARCHRTWGRSHHSFAGRCGRQASLVGGRWPG